MEREEGEGGKGGKRTPPMKIRTCNGCGQEYVYIPASSKSKDWCWRCYPGRLP